MGLTVILSFNYDGIKEYCLLSVSANKFHLLNKLNPPLFWPRGLEWVLLIGPDSPCDSHILGNWAQTCEKAVAKFANRPRSLYLDATFVSAPASKLNFFTEGNTRKGLSENMLITTACDWSPAANQVGWEKDFNFFAPSSFYKACRLSLVSGQLRICWCDVKHCCVDIKAFCLL